MTKLFSKNDDSFVCENCHKTIDKLGYTSRDHCSRCLCSKHVDILPGDRQNDCQGLMVPISCSFSTKKGYIITYKCTRCGEIHNNKAANDDNKNAIFAVMNGSYNKDNY